MHKRLSHRINDILTLFTFFGNRLVMHPGRLIRVKTMYMTEKLNFKLYDLYNLKSSSEDVYAKVSIREIVEMYSSYSHTCMYIYLRLYRVFCCRLFHAINFLWSIHIHFWDVISYRGKYPQLFFQNNNVSKGQPDISFVVGCGLK